MVKPILPSKLVSNKTKFFRRCEVQFAYAIGVAEPVSLLVHTFGTGTASEDSLAQAVRATFDCRPGALIKELNLLRPIYQKTSNYGHFGRADADWVRQTTGFAIGALIALS